MSILAAAPLITTGRSVRDKREISPSQGGPHELVRLKVGDPRFPPHVVERNGFGSYNQQQPFAGRDGARISW
jgi:hypothetical protein